MHPVTAAESIESEPQGNLTPLRLGASYAWGVMGLVVLAGLVLHFMAGPVPARAEAFYVLAAAPLLAVIYVLFQRNSDLARFFCSIPLAVASTTVTLAMALVGGLFPLAAIEASLGVPSVWASWPFVLSALVLAVNLSASSARRAWPLNALNLRFLLSHLGLLVVVVGGGISAVKIDRVNMVLFENRPTNIAIQRDGSEVMMPFAATLKDFKLEYFPPTLGIAMIADDPEVDIELSPSPDFIEEGLVTVVDDWTLEVLEYKPQAVLTGEIWRDIPWDTSAPAARVRATSAGGESHEGWVSCGSLDSPTTYLAIDPDHAVVMPILRAKKYESRVVIDTGDAQQEHLIHVNSPLSIGNAQLYQLSYNEEQGAASEYSVIEVVTDPGVPIVYFGIGMLLLSVLWGLWAGLEKKNS
jgi:hypothetical protein